jgi:hypothetical protein
MFLLKVVAANIVLAFVHRVLRFIRRYVAERFKVDGGRGAGGALMADAQR